MSDAERKSRLFMIRATRFMDMVTTRRAAHTDVDVLLPMLRTAAHGYPSQRAPYPLDDNAAAATLHGMIDYGVVLVAEMAGDVVGVIGGAVSRHPFDVSLLVLAHHFVVVAPAHRRAGIGAFLLDAFDREAEAQGAQWVTCSLAANTPRAVDEALVRMGYVESDRTYLREVGR